METKYYQTWEEKKEEYLDNLDEKYEEIVQQKVQPYDEMFFRFVVNLLM